MTAHAESLDALLETVTIDNPVEIELKQLLDLNGNIRRGRYVNEAIKAALDARGLVLEPEIERADYWGSVTISDRRAEHRLPHAAGLPVSSIAEDAPELVSITPDAPLSRIETLMLMHDYSQLPVLDKHRRVLHGTVTWKSIARSRADGSATATADEVMSIGAHVADSSDNLMDLVPRILSDDYIYYRNREKVIVGIVTASDLAATFQSSTGLFVRIGEIESRVRSLLDRLPVQTLKASLDEKIPRPDFRGAADMTFGEYIRVLENPNHWADLDIRLDRKTCIENLKQIAALRNDIMHFRPQADENDREASIMACLNWLKAAERG